MNKLLILLILFSANVTAQEKLNFDKRFVESEDHWVAFPADSMGTHNFGFIYIDSDAGLTLDHSGTFVIDANGKYIASKNAQAMAKYRLQPNNTLIAFIPDSKLPDLEVPQTPDWLAVYKSAANPIDRFYKVGYMYNGWNECAKGLEYLEKAYQIDPNYESLLVELAFSYNCLSQYQKAITILQSAVKIEPKNPYLYKEMIYAQVKSNQPDDAAATFRKTVDIPGNTYAAENAYNILYTYFTNKDIVKFNTWYTETNPHISKLADFKAAADAMKAELIK